MKKPIALSLVIILAGCSSHQYNYQMDYPLEAARVSLSGTVSAEIDCDKKHIKINNSSNEIFSRHVLSRLKSICHTKSGSFNVEYDFNSSMGFKYDVLSTQPNRTIIINNQ